jgi:2-keto-3-deoxy-L-rhamnonate aldolase RhmA
MSHQTGVDGYRNPVKARLAAGEPVFGITITTANLDSAAQAASLGFDFLWVEMEHSPVTLESLRNIVLATRSLPTVPFARVPVNELWTAKRMLDAGVHGVIFPFTTTPELAQRAAAACHYPPQGKRGSGAGLATRTWPDAGDYYDSADANVLVVTVVEEAAAVEQIDAIAATPGVDVLFIGTSDLSFSLGLRGAQNDPRLAAAIAKIAAAAKKHGKYLGRPLRDPSNLAALREQGFQFFQTPTDLDFLAAGASEYLQKTGKKVPK